MHTQINVVCSCMPNRNQHLGINISHPSDQAPTGTDTHRVLKLLADRADDGERLFQFRRQLICIHVSQAQHVTHLQWFDRSVFKFTFIHFSTVHLYTILQRCYLRDEGADLVLDLHEAAQSSLHDGGEVEQTQSVSRRSRVKHHHRKIHAFH